MNLSSRRFLAAAVMLAATLACAGPAAAQPPPLPTVQLTAGIHLITAEVAASVPDLTRGLMFRKSMPANHGMLFIFPRRQVQCMWMRNTLIPLSVAFLDDDGTVVNIEDMKPLDEASRHCSDRPVRLALEMNQGWFAQRGLGPGARIGRLPAIQQ